MGLLLENSFTGAVPPRISKLVNFVRLKDIGLHSLCNEMSPLVCRSQRGFLRGFASDSRFLQSDESRIHQAHGCRLEFPPNHHSNTPDTVCML
ncbi:hypothetical protein MLD38_008400 [Melastoma candidum]|uniref:Uncharacterized protein n=1 Tax=Melastoma candidum TaxID=119954 RepID=A0ACB9RVJ0_9MYRT|nr:hypothetical protein MLD38_008400 [Melastoma candidum]